jgi:SAM-dependent methyltransferase
MATGAFAVLDAVDLSPSRIAVARQRAEHEGTGGRLRFVAGDVRTIDPAPQSYDIVIFEDALHHFSPMHANLSRARSWLRPGGILVINEFVGPSRFQWTDEQLRAVNKLLEGLPWDLRVRHDGTPKPRVHRPGTLTMRLYDPSEAADSSHIIPAIRSMFDTREEHFYEGTVLHLLCKDIAHHFLTLDAERRSLLESCCDQEDLLIAGGKLTSDFAAIVALNLRGP